MDSRDHFVKSGDDYFTPALTNLREWAKKEFVHSIKDESLLWVQKHQLQPVRYYLCNARFSQAVTQILSLPALVKDKFNLWLQDEATDVLTMSTMSFNMAHRRMLNWRHQELQKSRDAKEGERLQRLAVEDCRARGYIVESLEEIDEETKETAFIRSCALGDMVATKLLFEARADPSAVTKDGNKKTALHWSAELGRADIADLLLKYNASRDAQDGLGRTPVFVAA